MASTDEIREGVSPEPSDINSFIADTRDLQSRVLQYFTILHGNIDDSELKYNIVNVQHQIRKNFNHNINILAQLIYPIT
jgi:hypothetical protein